MHYFIDFITNPFIIATASAWFISQLAKLLIHWGVYKEFDIKNRNSDVKVGKDGRVRVRDSDDNRYTIDDYKALDKHSRRQLIADL